MSEIIEEEKDGYTRIKADELKNLREGMKERDALRKEIEPLRRQTILASAKLADLTPKRITALFAAHGDDEITPEKLRATAVELGYAQEETKPVDEAEETVKAGQNAAQAARQSSQSTTGGLFTIADFSKLSPQKKREFAHTRAADMKILREGGLVKQ